MNKKLFKWDFWTGVTALAIVIFGLFLIYPLFSLFASAFQNAETGGFSLENFVRFFERKYYYQSMINSFWVTTCVTALAIVIVFAVLIGLSVGIASALTQEAEDSGIRNPVRVDSVWDR